MRSLRLFAWLLSCSSLVVAVGCGDDSASDPAGSTSTTTGGAGGGGTGGGASTGVGGAGGEPEPVPLPELLLAEIPTQSVEVAPMIGKRAGHTATLLPDGTLVVIGGEDISADRAQLATIERYDPAADTWTELPPLPEGRLNHTATLLGDGTILIVGGGGSNAIGSPSGLDVRTTALILDPMTGAIETIAGPAEPRHAHQAARLPSGKVLVYGGADDVSEELPSEGAGNLQPFGHPLASAEIFDPRTRTFAPTGSAAEARSSFVLLGLADGKVLVSGGIGDVVAAESLRTNEVFDEATGVFAPVGDFDGDDRLHHAGSRLADGRVLMFGGKKANVRFLGDLQAFDPTSGTFTNVGYVDVSSTRTVANVVPTVDGGAVVLGGLHCGFSGCDNPPETKIVAADGTVTEGPPLLRGRATSSATVLPDGSILVVGGYSFASMTHVERLMP